MRDLELLHSAIINNEPRSALPIVKKGKRASPKKQMEVYTQGYRIRLANAVAADHPAFCKLAGDKLSTKLIDKYVAKTPSASYSLNDYPLGFAAHIANADVSLAARELAQLESAIQKVFYLPDSEALTPQLLAVLAESSSSPHLNLRTASALLSFSHDVDLYLSEFRSGGKTSTPKKARIYIMVVRHENTVHRHHLHKDEYDILNAISSGANFNRAVSTVKAGEEFLQGYISNWLLQGFFRA